MQLQNCLDKWFLYKGATNNKVHVHRVASASCQDLLVMSSNLRSAPCMILDLAVSTIPAVNNYMDDGNLGHFEPSLYMKLTLPD